MTKLQLTPLPAHLVRAAVAQSLEEDLGLSGDITSQACLPADAVAREVKPRPKGWAQLGMYVYATLLVLVGISFVYTPDGTESTSFHQIVWFIRVGFVVFNLVLVTRLIQNGRAKAAQNQISSPK